MPASFRATAVGQDHVAVDPVDADGVVGRHGVDPVLAAAARPGRNCWWSQSPFRIQRPGPSSRALAAMRADELLPAPGVPELDALQGEAAGQEVGVAVDEAGQDERPAEVDELRRRARRGARTSAVVPTAKILSPRTATASAQGRAASPVQTFPLTSARSTMFPSVRS
ncbi:MAG: hypothetical protein M0C28_00615 [Candidatus Moduliflexus flocculans]|nr:hypothetical protein [Candidatus Moduliflexus flocculans]